MLQHIHSYLAHVDNKLINRVRMNKVSAKRNETGFPDRCPSAGSNIIFGVEISRLRSHDLVAMMTQTPYTSGDGVRLVVTMNVDHVVQLRRNAAFKMAYSRAWAVTIDGAPVFAYSQLRGLRIPERCSGADLLPELLRNLRPDVHRPFFVISQEETGRRLVEFLVARGFKRQQVSYVAPAFGFETDSFQCSELSRAIRTHNTTHLVMGLGAPKSEVWIDNHRNNLGDLFACAFGSGPDFLVGTMKRAPRVMRSLGGEALCRVATEPSRLWRRYFLEPWALVPAVLEDLSASQKGYY